MSASSISQTVPSPSYSSGHSSRSNTRPKYPTMYDDPVSMRLMKNPHIDRCGHTYDLKSLVAWAIASGIELEAGDYIFKCPLSKQDIKVSELVPNLLIKDGCDAIRAGTFFKNEQLHLSSRGSSRFSLQSDPPHTSSEKHSYHHSKSHSSESSTIYVSKVTTTTTILKPKKGFCSEFLRRVRVAVNMLVAGNLNGNKSHTDYSSWSYSSQKSSTEESVSFHSTDNEFYETLA